MDVKSSNTRVPMALFLLSKPLTVKWMWEALLFVIPAVNMSMEMTDSLTINFFKYFILFYSIWSYDTGLLGKHLLAMMSGNDVCRKGFMLQYIGHISRRTYI